ncbi:endoglucanase [Pseudomonas duriflava]|uniref:Endoglucanase n=1 Tax=Pseudomonas duriflava TaxID=459528 RepID=A0A562QLK2_9PSED|nr:hypothetical protein [Pseudomonas duriflava]TWI57621.1 endoglucanase [Pseudomonas duriflava]
MTLSTFRFASLAAALMVALSMSMTVHALEPAKANASAANQVSASVTSPINNFTNEHWQNGVYRTAAGISIPATQANIAAFVPQAKVLLTTGEIVPIKRVQVGDKNMAVWLQSPLLNGTAVGYPHKLTVGLNHSDPVPPQASAQKYKAFSTRINNFTNKDWLNGVYRKAAGISLPATITNRNAFKPGATVRLADGQTRLIHSTQVVGANMSIFLDTPMLDGDAVGYPKKITFVAPAP